jgi:hypothetical protein
MLVVYYSKTVDFTEVDTALPFKSVISCKENFNASPALRPVIMLLSIIYGAFMYLIPCESKLDLKEG